MKEVREGITEKVNYGNKIGRERMFRSTVTTNHENNVQSFSKVVETLALLDHQWIYANY
jgi:hypothetical protein